MAGSILEHLVSADVPVLDAETPAMALEPWLRAVRQAGTSWELPVERALAAGLASDRVGYAFAGGYAEALRALAPSLGEDIASLCATEATGAHPRAIETAVFERDGALALSGEKQWATLSPIADRLLVVAHEGTDALGRKRLCVWNVARGREGVRIEPMPEPPFAPEVPHAKVYFDGVRVAAEDRIPGDGYTTVLKPFRTIEDIHVHAAIVGHWVAIVRSLGGSREIGARLLMSAATLRSLGQLPASDTGVHLALAACIESTHLIIQDWEASWPPGSDVVRGRWERDRALLGVAMRARSKRLESAWQRAGSSWSLGPSAPASRRS